MLLPDVAVLFMQLQSVCGCIDETALLGFGWWSGFGSVLRGVGPWVTDVKAFAAARMSCSWLKAT